ncbi:hypothetical protein [Streptomyces sp. YGL11-2]|uniref:hypothetical protein n=1 Tax=Streptomyces sp. YGL11-2 TaxID=3414028 RepID=UPI003CEBE665
METTLIRLETSATEGRPSTGFAVPTAHTVIAVPRSATATSMAPPTERDLLNAVAQHLEGWPSNPQGIQVHRYGTGPRCRGKILESTKHPTVLSARGGPFDLHQAPRASDRPDRDDRFD